MVSDELSHDSSCCCGKKIFGFTSMPGQLYQSQTEYVGTADWIRLLGYLTTGSAAVLRNFTFKKAPGRLS